MNPDWTVFLKPGMQSSGKCLMAAGIFLALLAGCATPGAPGGDASQTRAEGAVAGALIGALLGNAAGNNRQGTVVGAAIGGLLGAVAGDKVATKKAEYAQREDQLLAAAAEARQVAQQTKEYNERLRKDIAQLEKTEQRLRNETMTAQARQQAVTANREKIASLLQQTDRNLVDVRKRIAAQQAMIQAEQQQPMPSANIVQVASGVQDMQIQERNLERALAQLRLIDSRRAY